MTQLAQQDPQNQFQLLRMILVDSLSNGRIVEMALAGGAVLTGRNGRGKTSLLQLLLLFYGESPNRIVTTAAGRKNFAGYYLPRVTSYLAYEYQRYDGHKRLVVAYADPNGDQVRFRFIRNGFDRQQFIDNEGNLVQSSDFARHLRLLGYTCSEQITSLTEYRAIIQAGSSGTRDRERQKQIRNLIADYAFTHSNRPLIQIEKIVSGMFRRKTNFEDLQSMVVASITEQDTNLSLSGDRTKIETWPKHYHAYQSVMALAPLMEDANTTHQHLLATEQALGEVYSQYRSLCLHLETSIQHLNEQYTQEQTTLEQEHAQYLQRRHHLQDLQRAACLEAESNEQRAAALLHEQNEYNRQQVAQKATHATREPELRREQQELRQRKVALTSKQGEITAHYQQLTKELTDQRNQSIQEIQAQQANQHTNCTADLQLLEQQYIQAEQQHQQIAEADRIPLQKAIDQANTAYGVCQHAARYPQPNPATEHHLQTKREQFDQRQQARNACDDEYKRTDNAYRKAKAAYEAQEQKVQHAQHTLKQAEQALQDIQHFHQPEPGTLLHFLRAQHADWTHDIAKVIRQDLFNRKDLEPELLEFHPSCYGLAVQLSKLEPHPLANPQDAQQGIAEAQQHLQTCQNQLQIALALLDKLEKERQTADHSRTQQHQQLLQADHLLRQVKEEVDEAKRQLENSRQQAKVEVEQKLQQAKDYVRLKQQQLHQFETERKSAELQRQQVYRAKCQQRQQQRDKALHAAQIRQDSLEQTYKTKLQEYEKESLAALQAQGVDVKQLQTLDSQLQNIKVSLDDIARHADLVNRWKYWIKREWPQHTLYCQNATQQRAAERNHSEDLKTLEQQWHQHKQVLDTTLLNLRKQKDTLQHHYHTAQRQLETLQAYSDKPIPAYDASWTIDTLTARLNNLRNTEISLQRDLRNTITALQKGFNRHPNTPPEQYLSNHLHELPPMPGREWLPLFQQWFNSNHIDTQRLLLIEARTIASSILDFHHKMEDFHRKVLQFNRELQANLTDSLMFDSISEVTVEIVSTIKELQYWPAICELAETNRHWVSNLEYQLPPAEFAHTIIRLLEYWEIKSGIRADFKHLLRIQGEVTENGNRRTFRRATDLEAVSSNGLSYLILVMIFVAFINRIRRHTPVNIVWALDELKDLDSGNVPALLKLLHHNDITLVSAFPDPDPETLELFRHCYTVEPDRRLAEVRLASDHETLEALTHV